MVDEDIKTWNAADCEVSLGGRTVDGFQTFWKDGNPEITHIDATTGPSGYNRRPAKPAWRLVVKATSSIIPYAKQLRDEFTATEVIFKSPTEVTRCLQAVITKIDTGDQGPEANDVTIEGLAIKINEDPR